MMNDDRFSTRNFSIYGRTAEKSRSLVCFALTFGYAAKLFKPRRNGTPGRAVGDTGKSNNLDGPDKPFELTYFGLGFVPAKQAKTRFMNSKRSPNFGDADYTPR